jgi:ABC-type multidrug transport system fused ATPase/permease subunit
LSLIATITEVFGIGIFLPIFQFIRLQGDLNALVLDSNIWQYIINAFSYFNIDPSLPALLLISFTFFLGRQLFTYLRLVYGSSVKHRLIQKKRNHVFNKYLKTDTPYQDKTPVGSLVNIIVTEVNRAVAGILAPLELLVHIITLIGYLIVLYILSWQMTLFSVIALLLASFVPKVWIKQSAVTGRKLVDANTLISKFLVSRLKSSRLVRLSNTENLEKKYFYNLTFRQRKHMMFNSILQSKTEVSMEPAIIGGSLILLYFAYSVLKFQVEVIGLYLVIAMRLMPVVKSIMKRIQTIQSMLGSIEVLENRLVEMEASLEKNNGSKNIIKVERSIVIKDVDYSYKTDKNYALKNITVEFKSNEMTAIVGPSGSGKSTLIDLLPRLRVPTSGKILIDDINIEDFKLKDLRQLISYVPQSPQIFDGTIEEHIMYGNSDVTSENILDSVKLSGAESFINQLPQKFNTILGEDAVRLSGGQRQRLDIARALARKAPIIILDEPTSNLDVESEKAFNKILHGIRKNTDTTIIIISHRLSSIVDSDKIIVINKGLIESTGAHIDLLKKKGWYSKAWKMQNSTKNSF